MEWGASWAWGLSLTVVSVIIHVFGIAMLTVQLERLRARLKLPGRFKLTYALVICVATFSLTTLHGLEALMWAIAYQVLNALPNQSEAMLYSLEAMTAYGHEAVSLDQHWRMMGAIEALNGLMLLGLTTAFLFTVMQRAWTAHGIEKLKIPTNGSR